MFEKKSKKGMQAMMGLLIGGIVALVAFIIVGAVYFGTTQSTIAQVDAAVVAANNTAAQGAVAITASVWYYIGLIIVLAIVFSIVGAIGYAGYKMTKGK